MHKFSMFFGKQNKIKIETIIEKNFAGNLNFYAFKKLLKLGLLDVLFCKKHVGIVIIYFQETSPLLGKRELVQEM